MGLRNELVGSLFPTLKRGANIHCAYGAGDERLQCGVYLHMPLGLTINPKAPSTAEGYLFGVEDYVE